MKHILFSIIVLFCITTSLSAQYSLSLKVWDEENNAPIPYATIGVLKSNNTLIQGGLSDENGDVTLNIENSGSYDLRISYLGFEEKRIENISINGDQNLGKVSMQANAQALEEFKVTGKRSYVQYGLEKKVFNVEDNLASTTGDATELLRNIPSITVDQEGNISLRGSQNIRILINGQESGLAGLDRRAVLSQIDASSIKNIEVITNPSAKYDPEGSGGIINITTKKMNKKGFNLITSLNGGTGPRLNGSITSNLKVGKWNLTAGYSGRYNESFRRGITDRTTYLPSIDSLYRQYYDFLGTPLDKNHNANAGIEYIINSNTSISLNGNIGISDEDDPAARISDFYDNLGNQSHYSWRRENEAELGSTKEINANYNQIFDNLDQSLDISVRYSQRNDEESSLVTDSFFYMDESLWYSTIQSNGSIGERNTFVSQLDFVYPFNKQTKLETGGRFNRRVFDNDYTLNNVDPVTLQETVNELFSNHFIYTENISAAYGIFSHKFNALSTQVGLRYEYTSTLADLVEIEQVPNDYHMLFPSAAVSYEWNETQSIQASYSRRINRPRTWSLNPFTDYSDPLNIRRGNPYLLPETINSYEVNYQVTKDKGSIAASVFHRETNQIITRITEIQNDSVRISTSTNLASGQNSGLELILSIRPTKWWNINTNYSVFRSKLDGSNVDANLANEGYMGSGRFMSMMNFKNGFGIQISGFYRTPMVRIQGTTAAIYSFDCSIQQKLFDGKGTVSLRLSDVFDTRQWAYFSEQPGLFELNGVWKRQSRILVAGFRYSLQQETRRARNERGRSGMGGDEMDF